MSTHVSATTLIQAMKEITRSWEDTRTHWRDVKSQEFEQKYLEELPHHIARAGAAIEELNGILRKVRSDCE
ncbi:MAG: hypothetical protein ABIP97_00285 [Chthoniobacterales bacterium]